MVDKCRLDLAVCEERRHKIKNAGIPSKQQIENCFAQLDALAEQGALNFYRVKHGGEIEFPTLVRAPTLINGAAKGILQNLYGEEHNGLAFTVWLHLDAIKARVKVEILKSADDSHSLDDAKRGELLISVAKEKLAVERIEEAAIELSNGTVLRRSDADVRAVLGLSGDMPVPNED